MNLREEVIELLKNDGQWHDNAGRTFALVRWVNYKEALTILKAEQPPEGELTKRLRLNFSVGKIFKTRWPQLHFRELIKTDVLELCDRLDASQAENRQLKGEEPIPFAWWKDCPKLAQKTMERMIERFSVLATSQEELLAALKKYGDHEPGCIKGDACNCGLKKAIEKGKE